MSLLKDLPELVNANIISGETARQIREYYKTKEKGSPNRQMLIFGILGALLVGTGLLFIIANQWDEFSQTIRTLWAFLLLLVPQFFAGYVLLKKPDKVVWRESAALLLFFAVGASISLIAQIYAINGDTAGFLMIWLILTAPLIYLLDTSALSLVYLFTTMIYCLNARYDGAFAMEEYIFWVLFVLPLPRYYRLFRQDPENLLVTLHHWMIVYVLTQTLFTLSHQNGELMHLAYIAMFAIFYFIGKNPFFKNRHLLSNGYLVFGFTATIISLLIMTFKTSWKDLTAHVFKSESLVVAPEFIACFLLFVIATVMLYRQNKGKKLTEWNLMDITYLLFLLIFMSGTRITTVSVILMNLLVLAFGLSMLREGSKLSHLGVLNLGMLVITILAVCRSFDTDLTFVLKGSMFVLVGCGFFAANWLMIKKRKDNEA